jgi:glycogen(starch) synthase
MRILVTADTVGGVWTYSRELVTGLLRLGARVTLVSFGDLPTSGQTRWMESIRGRRFDYRPTAFKLEWMQDSAADMKASSEYLRGVIRETEPGLLHFSQFYYGALDCDVPRVVVAHSDVVSWWAAVHGQEPPQTSWMSWYREAVARGLEGATAVIAPSQWMLDQVQRHYLKPHRASVIYNGRTPAVFNPHANKEERIVTAGRLWDEAKNAGIFLRGDMPAPVLIVGADHHSGLPDKLFALQNNTAKVQLQCHQDEEKMVQILACSSIYAAPSKYEPFGLAPVEAALSRCALVASDIPSLRELWQDAAVFFKNNDPQDLRRALELLVHDPSRRHRYADVAYNHARRKFSAARMVSEYLELYRTLAPAAMPAA